jgi:GTP-binding protein YchF
MSLKCGIVGLPNVGKSTLFNALTVAGIEAQNFPFCTIEPNQGIVPVPDERLDKISQIVQPKATIPTTTEFVDIAGLVKGASEGEGLGNQFLSHIDLEVVETELLLADLEIVNKARIKLERVTRSGDKKGINQFERLQDLEEQLSKGILGRESSYAEDNDTYFKDLQLITMKPCLYVANVEENLKGNEMLKQLQQYADSRGTKVLPLCNQIEAELAELDLNETKEFLEQLDMDEPGLNKLIRASYEMLELQTFFTAGPKEVRAWTISKGSSAPQAAGEIHTDFEKGFIRAETISYPDFIKYEGENGAQKAGKLRSEGSDYLVKDGDIIHFKFNV